MNEVHEPVLTAHHHRPFTAYCRLRMPLAARVCEGGSQNSTFGAACVAVTLPTTISALA